MIDTHAHLHVKAFDGDRAETLARAFAAGLTAILEVCIDAGGWPHALRLARSDPRVFLTAGIHPHDAGRATEEQLDGLFSQLGEPSLRALGETGLDYYRNYAPHDLQRRFFARHVAVSVEAGLPLVVHVRDAQGSSAAHDDAARILQEEGRGRARGVFHCFSGDLAQARSAVSLGFLLGLGGGITYNPGRSAPLLRAITREFGPGVFVLETDCPYQTPHPHRRERNEPANIPAIAQALAAYIGMSPREAERATDSNARALFRLEA